MSEVGFYHLLLLCLLSASTHGFNVGDLLTMQDLKKELSNLRNDVSEDIKVKFSIAYF